MQLQSVVILPELKIQLIMMQWMRLTDGDSCWAEADQVTIQQTHFLFL